MAAFLIQCMEEPAFGSTTVPGPLVTKALIPSIDILQSKNQAHFNPFTATLFFRAWHGLENSSL